MSAKTINRTSLFVLTFAVTAPSQQPAADPRWTLLWPGGAPGALGDEDRDQPALRVHPAPADKRNGTAVVACPGGGYGNLALDHKGRQIADMKDEPPEQCFWPFLTADGYRFCAEGGPCLPSCWVVAAGRTGNEASWRVAS